MFVSCQEFDFCFLLPPPDLPPVYTFSPVALGYKAGPSPPEARLAEHPLAEDEPAGPESKSLSQQCHVQPLTVEEEMRKEEEDCKVVKSLEEAKGCSDSETGSPIFGLLPCPFQAPVLDLAAKGDISRGCSGQKAGLEEPQLFKEEGDDEEHGKVDFEEINMEPEPTECTISVPAEPEEEEAEQEGENVEVVEDIKVKEDRRGKSPAEDLEVLCLSPAPSQSADPGLPPRTSAAAQLEGAYMWSLELLIAAALCASRDALCPPVPVDQAPCPSAHRGMEILGELAELEVQQRRRECKHTDADGKNNSKKF